MFSTVPILKACQTQKHCKITFGKLYNAKSHVMLQFSSKNTPRSRYPPRLEK